LKNIGHSLKNLRPSQKTPSDPSWLRAWRRVFIKWRNSSGV